MTPAADWPIENLRALRKRYSTTTDVELALDFGVPEEEVAAVAAELALAKDKRTFKGRAMPRWTHGQLLELQRDYATTSNVKLARRFGRSVKALCSKAHNMGLKKSEDRLVAMGRENVMQRRDRGTLRT